MDTLLKRTMLATLVALVPMIGLHIVALNFDGMAEVVIRFIGAALIFSAAWALTERFGPYRRRSN